MSVPFGKAAEEQPVKAPEVEEDGFITVHVSPPLVTGKQAAQPRPASPKLS